MCTFYPGHFTGCGSEMVKPQLHGAPSNSKRLFFFAPEKQSKPLPSSLRHKGVKPPHLIQTHKRLKRTLILMDCTKLVKIFGICPFFKMTGKRRKMKILYLSGICLDLVLKH